MNKVILIGNLTRDPELTTTNSGIPLCRFGIAVNRNFTNSEGNRDVDFFNITAWRGLGETCNKYLSKGSKVAIHGNIQVRSYETNGEKRTAFDIIAEDVEFLSQRNAGGDGGRQVNDPTATPTQPSKKDDKVVELEPIDETDLPF